MASRLCKLLAAADRNCTSVMRECSSKHTPAIRLFNQQQSPWDDVQLQHAVNTSHSPGILRFNICCTWVRNWAHYDNHFFNETTCIHSPIPAHTGRCQQVRWQTPINNWQQLTAAEIDWWLQQWLHSDAGFRWGVTEWLNINAALSNIFTMYTFRTVSLRPCYSKYGLGNLHFGGSFNDLARQWSPASYSIHRPARKDTLVYLGLHTSWPCPAHLSFFIGALFPLSYWLITLRSIYFTSML